MMLSPGVEYGDSMTVGWVLESLKSTLELQAGTTTGVVADEN
jgi:hypothetical protein